MREKRGREEFEEEEREDSRVLLRGGGKKQRWSFFFLGDQAGDGGESCVEESLREKNRACFKRERTEHFFLE